MAAMTQTHRMEPPTRERAEGRLSVQLTRWSFDEIITAYTDTVAAIDQYDQACSDLWDRYFAESHAAHAPNPSWPNYYHTAEEIALYIAICEQNTEPTNWNGSNGECYPIKQWKASAATYRREVRRFARLEKAIKEAARVAA